MEDKARKALTSALLSAFRSETNSEVTITCGVRRWKAHRDVVCSGSKVFEKALNGGFKEGKTNVIELKEEEPELVERMLLYFYTLDYPISTAADKSIGSDNAKTSGESDPPAVVHAKMYALADKYELDQGLRDLCTTKFKAEAEKYWKDASFVDACVLAFRSTPESDRGLRDVVVEIVVTNAKELMQWKIFNAALKEMGTLGLEAFAEMALNGGGPLPKMLYCDRYSCKQNRNLACGGCNYGSHVSPARKG